MSMSNRSTDRAQGGLLSVVQSETVVILFQKDKSSAQDEVYIFFLYLEIFTNSNLKFSNGRDYS